MSAFVETGEGLRRWAEQVRDARAEVIADMTKETIRDLASELGLPPKFTTYIEDYERLEGALQSIADYRDHFVHPFHVFCLGYLILRSWQQQSVMPLELLKAPDPDGELKMWFIAAVYHDVGFPAEKLETLSGEFFMRTVGRQLKCQFDWSSVMLANDNVRYIDNLSALFARKRAAPNADQSGLDQWERLFEKWFHKRLLEDHDHGALAALMLLNQDWSSKRKEPEETRAWWHEARNEAALAIALHSYRRPPRSEAKRGKSKLDVERQLEFDIGPLAVEDFPLAFYLTYCDTAQEWGRKALLELMRNVSTSAADGSPEFLGGLDSKLEEPVPELSPLSSVLASPRGPTGTKTTVKIQYPAEDRRTKIRGRKTLGHLFDDAAEKFKSTWYLLRPDERDFWIQGTSRNRTPVGFIYPYRRAAGSGPL